MFSYAIMMECWDAERALRPTFVELCDQFGAFVEEVAGNYGYITASLLAATFQ
jgi:hypothetical protein